MRKLLFGIVIFFAGLFYYFLQPAITDDKKLLEKLIFPAAYDVGSGYNDQLKRTVISYKVQLKYPSKKILEFYNNKFEEIGWQKKRNYFLDKDLQWMDFIDRTQEGKPLIHQLSATWNNKEKSKMITLVSNYYSYYPSTKEKLYSKEPNTDVLDIIIQIEPYIDMPKNPINLIYIDKEKNIEIHGDTQTWSQLFQFYVSHIKPMSSTDSDTCKKLLKETLDDLDTKNNCKSNDECTLIDEGLFSTHLPFPHNLTDALSIKMKNYRKQCHDGKTFIFSYNDWITTPVCWEERCMVKTGLKK